MSETILIIESNPDDLRYASQILQLSNYNVVFAHDGKSGLELAKTSPPDLIFCDSEIPELNGYGVMRAQQNNPDLAGIPFIITTKLEKFRYAMEQGADDCLVKPFNGDDLLKAVNIQMRKRKLLRQSFLKSKTLHGSSGHPRKVNDIFNISDFKIKKKIKRNEILYLEGEYPNFIYVLISGKVKTLKTNHWGEEYIMNIHREKDIFGYKSMLFEENSRRESAIAIEDSEIAYLAKEDFFQYIEANPEILFTLLKATNKNLIKAEDRLLRLAYDPARKKVAEALAFISRIYNVNDKTEETFPVFRENISGITGLSKESVSRKLTDLRKEGLIETDKNGKMIIIKDRTRLESLKW